MLPVSTIETLVTQFFDFTGDPNGLEQVAEKNAKSKLNSTPTKITAS